MSSDYERIEWVEIIEPRTKEHMYANLTTGECVWDPPESVPIKRTDSSQWWELFDTNTQRFYYYNAATQRTVWHRPTKCDIIPLAKLQTLKQNTDPSERKERSTQTGLQSPRPKTQSSLDHARKDIKEEVEKKGKESFLSPSISMKRQMPIKQAGISRNASNAEIGIKTSSDLLLSPRVRQSSRSITSAEVPKNYASRRFEDPCMRFNASGKSSDSSLSSTHGQRRFIDAGVCNVGAEHLQLGSLQKHQSRKVSSSKTGIDHQPHHAQSFSAHLSSLEKASPTHSVHTPELTKKTTPGDELMKKQQQYAQQQRGSAAENRNSFKHGFGLDHRVGLSRSGSFMSASVGSGCAAPPYITKSYRKSSEETNGAGVNGGNASDDSMHEKYFKSVESTPMTRRHHLTNKSSSGGSGSNEYNKKNSSDSSAQSPNGSQEVRTKSRQYARQTLPSPGHGETVASTPEVTASHIRHKEGSSSLDLLNLDRLSFNPKAPTSPQLSDVVIRAGDMDRLSPNNAATISSLRNFTSSDNICSVLTQSSRGSYDSARNKSKAHMPATNENRSLSSVRNNFASLDKHSTRRNGSYYDSKKRDKQPKEKNYKKRAHQRAEYSLNHSDMEFEPGNTSPLYSNWDQEMQEHLLPIKHYILEQAKLSRRYVFGDPADSDSYHSDSQSEDSLSGHEPDNEDSDGGSDTHGTYLEHNYGIIDDYANTGESVSYYAYQYPPYDPAAREHISDNVEAVLESIGDNHEFTKHLQPQQPRQHVSQIKPKPRTPTSLHYDTVDPSTSYTHQYPQYRYNQAHQAQEQTQQHYTNAAMLNPPTQMQKKPVQQYLQLDSEEKQKQSQTLPSPNRHLIRMHKHSPGESSNAVDGTGSRLNTPLYTKDEQTLKQSTITAQTAINQKPISRPTIQQLFQPMDSLNVGLNPLNYVKDCDIEKFAADNLNLHSKGLFRKKASVRDMLSWTAEAITRPMLALSRDKTDKKIAIELFKLVQIYMGDRKARVGMSLNSVAIDIINAAFPQHQLRDELYVQLCRQTTENPKRDSLIRGWELMAICLGFLPPSPTFQPTLLNYVNRHRDPSFAMAFPEVGKWPIHVQISHYATVCCRRLERIGSSGRRQAKKPSEEEVEQARTQILRNSMFGNTLAEVMELQKDKFPLRKLPWIQTTLSEHVLILNGKQTEGIFRVSADVDEVNCLKNRLDRWEVPDYKNSMVEAHAPASLLKLWYRELYDPLIPDEFYEECVNTENPEKAQEIVQRLPELNRLVLTYLIHFLQQFTLPSVVTCTKMDSSNLAMVFAPNCLRCTSDDPKVILENARKEMSFMRTLIQHMDTSFVANLV